MIRVYNPISNPFSLKEKLFSPDSISSTKLEELFKGKYLPPESLKKTTLILPPITLFSFANLSSKLFKLVSEILKSV